jgi:hypothetical protein
MPDLEQLKWWATMRSSDRRPLPAGISSLGKRVAAPRQQEQGPQERRSGLPNDVASFHSPRSISDPLIIG